MINLLKSKLFSQNISLSFTNVKQILESNFENFSSQHSLSEDEIFDLKIECESLIFDFKQLFDLQCIMMNNEPVILIGWSHVKIDCIESNWRDFRLHRPIMIEITNNYLNQYWAKDESIDLLLVDMLLFAETLGVYAAIEKAKFNKTKNFHSYRFGTEDIKKYQKSESYMSAFWFIVFVALCFTLPIGAMLLFSIFLVKKIIKAYLLNKTMEVYSKMTVTYDSVLYKDWGVLWGDLHNSRRYGAVWDKEVFEIVRRNTINNC